ncbi:MAG: glycosyltransferase family 9 protein [Simkaniaceae bacterium]
MKKTVALLSASGIGDALLMMIAYHNLEQRGFEPTFFHEKAEALSFLFPLRRIKKPSSCYAGFDFILIENDNSKRAWDLFRIRENLPSMHVFFPSPCRAKKEQDFLFNPKMTVASSIALGLEKFFGGSFSKENGLTPPLNATYRKYKKRIILHPTSSSVKRNWLPKQFISLSKKLISDGFSPAFLVSKSEYPYWEFAKSEGIDVPFFDNLNETAHYIYESGYFIGNDSGLGHLASNLKIQTLTLSGNARKIRLWRPDFFKNDLLTTPFPLPNFKGIGLTFRDHFWPLFLPVTHVYNRFKKVYGKSSHYTG